MERKFKINNFKYQEYLLQNKYGFKRIKHQETKKRQLVFYFIIASLAVSILGSLFMVFNARDVDRSNPFKVNFTKTLTFADESKMSFQSSLVYKKGDKYVI